MEGRCTYCGKRRRCWRIQRFGGGNYRRAGRWNWGRICGECVTDLLDGTTEGQTGTRDRYSLTSLRMIRAELAAASED